MTIKTEATLHCHTCDKDTNWRIEHRVIDYHGICHVYICNDCGKMVPEFAMSRYQQTRRVVIPV